MTPVKSATQTTPGKSPGAHGTPVKSPGHATPAKSPKVTRTPDRSPHAQITPSKSHLLLVDKGRKGSATSVVGASKHESVAVLSESVLARTASLNGPPSVANGSAPHSQVNGASTLVNNDGYPWDDRDDITLEMITDVGEDTGDEEVSYNLLFRSFRSTHKFSFPTPFFPSESILQIHNTQCSSKAP